MAFVSEAAAINYYEHHIGDYAAATAHLTLVEDAVYSRMLRRYYLQEVPLPADVAQVARLVGARSADELEAVRVVLSEFFTLADDGWHNKRADAEIESYRAKCGKAAKSASARWAKKEAPALPPDSGRNANALPTHSEGNALHTPDTKHHISVGKSEEDGNLTASASAADRPPDISQATAACVEMRKAGVPATQLNPMHAELIAACADGATPAEFGATASELIAAGKPAHMTYIVRAVMGRRRDAQQGARASPTPADRPRVADTFTNRVYTGTPDDDLPEHLRPAA